MNELPLGLIVQDGHWRVLVVGCVAFVCCLLLTKFLLSRRLIVGLDLPDQRRKRHHGAVPRLGGVPIFLTLLGGFAYAYATIPDFIHNWWPVIVSCVIMFGVGFFDDLKPLGARVKFLMQIIAATLMFLGGVSIDIFSDPFGEGQIALGIWSYPVTVLWLVAIPNIINLIDGMDGLATGFGLFLCVTLAILGQFMGVPEVVLLSAVMAGALLGFLLFNLPPARIFLGDGGAYLIGFFIAALSLKASHKGSVLASLLVIMIASGIPILDTTFAIVRRAIRGVPIFRADAEHIHHRLILLGFSKTKALVAMYTACLVLSVIGLSVLLSRGLALPIIGAVACLCVLGVARYLGYVRSWRDVRNQFNRALARRREMIYASTYARVLEWEVDRCREATEFSSLLTLALGRVGIKIRPSHGLNEVDVRLSNGSTCILYYPAQKDMESLWIARVDLFSRPISLALERFGKIPDLVINAVQSGEPSAGLTPGKSTPI